MTLQEYYDLPPDSTFLASVKAVIQNTKGEILMLRTPKGDLPWSDKWGFPGGLVEFNESITDALVREIKEELNLAIKVEKVFAVGSYFISVPFTFRDKRVMRVRVIGLCYRASLVDPETPIVISDEHRSFAWLPLSEIPSLSLSGDSKFIVEELGFAS